MVLFLADSECHSYNSVNDSTRDISYSDGSYLCDNTLITKWYRFVTPGSTMIPERCVQKNRETHCRTHRAGWLSRQHPTVAEGIVSRKVCFSWENNCCEQSNNISVRNCGSFFVYELKQTATCYDRYCTAGEH